MCAKLTALITALLTLAACGGGGGGAAGEGEQVSDAGDCGEGLQACPAFNGCEAVPGFVCQSAGVACEGGGASIACRTQYTLDLELTVDGLDAPIEPGSEIPVVATIENHGPDEAPLVRFAIVLPQPVTLVEPSGGWPDVRVARTSEGQYNFDTAIAPNDDVQVELSLAIDAASTDMAPSLYAVVSCPVTFCTDTNPSNDGGTFTVGAGP